MSLPTKCPMCGSVNLSVFSTGPVYRITCNDCGWTTEEEIKSEPVDESNGHSSNGTILLG